MKKCIIIQVVLLLATTAIAQTFTPRQEREFYRKAYDLIRSYKKVSQVSDDQTATQFYDLFVNPNVEIYNDLMSLSDKPSLAVNEYIDLLRNADMVNVDVKDVKKTSRITEDNGLLKLTLSFLKNISFVSPCETYFDSRDFFGKDYNMEMTLVYNPTTGECKISELKSNSKDMTFPSDFKVLIRRDKRDNNLNIKGQNGYVNFQMDQKVLRPEHQLYYRGAKVQEKRLGDKCDNKIYASYNDKSWRIRLNGGFSVADFNKLGNSEGVDVSKNSEMSFGLDLGYVFPTTSHLRFGIFAGVGMSSNNLDISMSPDGTDTNLKCEANQDVDGNPYTRIYEGADNNTLEITQKLSATDLAVPVYLDMEYEFNSKFSVYADAGLKFSLPMSSSTKIGNSALMISGKYNEYKDPAGNPIVIDRYINNFGKHEKDYLKPWEDAVSAKTAIDAILGLGVRLNITKSIALDAGVQYQTGTNSWTSNENLSIFKYELKEGGFNDGVDYVNLMSKVKSLSHSAVRANISLIFKL